MASLAGSTAIYGLNQVSRFFFFFFLQFPELFVVIQQHFRVYFDLDEVDAATFIQDKISRIHLANLIHIKWP